MIVHDMIKVITTVKPSEILLYKKEEFMSLVPELYLYEKYPNYIHNYEYKLQLLDSLTNDLVVRLAAIFYDLGRFYASTNEKIIGIQVLNENLVSDFIFKKFAKKNNLDAKLVEEVSKIILNQNINIKELTGYQFIKLKNQLGIKSINYLIEIKHQEEVVHKYRLFDFYKNNKKMLNRGV